MVPLVFKTSLGVVRSPEGSTPSLLRQEKLVQFALQPIVAQNRCISTSNFHNPQVRKRIRITLILRVANLSRCS